MGIREKLLNGRKPYEPLSPEERKVKYQRWREETRKAENKAIFWGVFWFLVIYIPGTIIVKLIFR